MQVLQLRLMAGALLRQYAIMIRCLFREPALKRQTLTLERFTRKAISRVASSDRRLSTLLPAGKHGGHLDLLATSLEPELFVRTLPTIVATDGGLGTHDLHARIDERPFERSNPSNVD